MVYGRIHTWCVFQVGWMGQVGQVGQVVWVWGLFRVATWISFFVERKPCGLAVGSLSVKYCTAAGAFPFLFTCLLPLLFYFPLEQQHKTSPHPQNWGPRLPWIDLCEFNTLWIDVLAWRTAWEGYIGGSGTLCFSVVLGILVFCHIKACYPSPPFTMFIY